MLKIRLIKDRMASQIMLGITIFCLFILVIIGTGLLIKSIPVLQEKSLWELLSTSSWKPFKGDFGFLSFIVSTLYVTFIAIVIALPLSLLSAIYLSEYASVRVRRFFSPVVDLLAGIPSVVYGVWGTLTIVPLIADKIAPRFVDFSTGYSVLAAGLVLAIMITPIIISILTEVFNAIPKDIREASWSLGANKWETIKKVVLRKSFPGIVAATVLALSRAFGETIAVLMVCGNFTDLPRSIFDACYPLPALIANNYGEMMSLPAYESALMFSALLLFVIIVLFNAGSRLLLNRINRRVMIGQ
jgi:phosphate transport system permease protein